MSKLPSFKCHFKYRARVKLFKLEIRTQRYLLSYIRCWSIQFYFMRVGVYILLNLDGCNTNNPLNIYHILHSTIIIFK